MLYNSCTGIYKFGNNTYPRRIRRRSNLGHIFRGKKKCVLWAGKYGICYHATQMTEITPHSQFVFDLSQSVLRMFAFRFSLPSSFFPHSFPFHSEHKITNTVSLFQLNNIDSHLLTLYVDGTASYDKRADRKRPTILNK
jgi:hypothetical protein